MAIKALVFDADGTLYDVHSVYAKTEELCPGKGDLISQRAALRTAAKAVARLPNRVNRVILIVRRALPGCPQLPTYRCAALSDVQGHKATPLLRSTATRTPAGRPRWIGPLSGVRQAKPCFTMAHAPRVFLFRLFQARVQ